MKIKFLVLSLLAVQAIFAQNTVPVQLNIFKNGTYFVMREGNANITNYEAPVMAPAAPLLSTYWLSTTKDTKVEQIRFVYDTLKNKRSFASYPDLLKANTGKKIRVAYSIDDKNIRELAGTLGDFNTASQMLKIKTTDNKTTFLYSSQIKELTFDEAPIEKVEVDKSIYAAVTECSDAGVFKKAGSYYGVNPLTNIKWDLNLKGGEKKKVTYSYEVLVQ
jgi:hypothetical protein